TKVDRIEQADGFQAVFRMYRIPIERGEPLIRFLPAIGPDGFEYPEMSAEVDIFLLDGFEQLIAAGKVIDIALNAGIQKRYLNFDACHDYTKQCIAERKAIRGAVVASGKFPDPGADAVVEFFFPAEPEPGQLDRYYSSRRISNGSYICRKTHPKQGKNPGYNVKGEMIRPATGMDVELIAGDGAEVTPLSWSVTATRDGVVEIHRKNRRIITASGEKIVPVEIHIAVRPIRVIESESRLSVSTDDAIEIRGNLTIGSEIVSSSDIYVRGSVDEGSYLRSKSDIHVRGEVRGSILTSDKNVLVRGNVSRSEISAQENVIIEGAVNKSQLSGDRVTADSAFGTRIVANHSVTLKNIDSDEDRVISSIVVGMRDFYQARIDENTRFIEKAIETLTQLTDLFGEETVERVAMNTIQIYFIKHIATLKHRPGWEPLDRNELTNRRKLLEAVPLTKIALNARRKENMELKARLESSQQEGEALVTVTERIGAGTQLSIGGNRQKIETPQVGRSTFH
ncbi:MAG: FapA family protein, partial [bacterium]|nr:FapA family protein [bacterium]